MLVEVKRELVKQDHRYLQKRFLQDATSRLAIYIWQLPDDDEGEMLRFQVSYRDIALDWAAERGMRYAFVDDGDHPMGMKRSPVLNDAGKISGVQVERLLGYLENYAARPSLQFIRQIIERDARDGAP